MAITKTVLISWALAETAPSEISMANKPALRRHLKNGMETSKGKIRDIRWTRCGSPEADPKYPRVADVVIAGPFYGRMMGILRIEDSLWRDREREAGSTDARMNALRGSRKRHSSAAPLQEMTKIKENTRLVRGGGFGFAVF
jgi:hypothetical protein